MIGCKALGIAGVTAGVFVGWIRPRLMRWGATGEEVARPYPGANVVPDGKRAATMAVTIDAAPDQVWPWLVQMGWDRGGWYSWDRLDNAGRRSATAVHPEWQDLAVGDRLRAWSPRGLDSRQPRSAAYMEGLWGFQLNELLGKSSRLVIGGYQAVVVWIMQARMLAVLKRNVERAMKAPVPSVASREDTTLSRG
jgi:hypothetical protein